MPVKVMWIRKIRTLRRLLKKYRDSKKIDRHVYHTTYLSCKAGTFKSKQNLMDHIEKVLYKMNLEKTQNQKKALKEEGKKQQA